MGFLKKGSFGQPAFQKQYGSQTKNAPSKISKHSQNRTTTIAPTRDGPGSEFEYEVETVAEPRLTIFVQTNNPKRAQRLFSDYFYPTGITQGSIGDWEVERFREGVSYHSKLYEPLRDIPLTGYGSDPADALTDLQSRLEKSRSIAERSELLSNPTSPAAMKLRSNIEKVTGVTSALRDSPRELAEWAREREGKRRVPPTSPTGASSSPCQEKSGLRICFTAYPLSEVEQYHSVGNAKGRKLLTRLEEANTRRWWSPIRWYESACSAISTAIDLAGSAVGYHTAGDRDWDGQKQRSVCEQFLQVWKGEVPLEFNKVDTYVDVDKLSDLTRWRDWAETFDKREEKNKRDALRSDRDRSETEQSGAQLREEREAEDRLRGAEQASTSGSAGAAAGTC